MNTNTTGQAETPMPKYKCHKEVWALKIKAIEQRENINNKMHEFLMVAEESRFAPIVLEESYVLKHRPLPGGYYVVYDDGYKSYSPAKAFEEGYSLIN